MTSKLFEIIVPTRNRRELALRRIREFVDYGHKNCGLLISDNQSDDGTFAAALPFQSDEIRVRQTSGEASFFNNIISSLMSCDAEWGILCSDEDTVNVECLDHVASLCSRQQIDLILGSVTPQELPFKGKGRTFTEMTPLFSEIRNHNYVSGVCFRISSWLPTFQSIADTVSRAGNFFLEYYPHQAMIWQAFVQGSLASTVSLLITRGPSARSSLPVKKTSSAKQSLFVCVEGRWQNWMGAHQWVASMATHPMTDEQRHRHKILGNHHDHQLLPILRHGISYDYPESLPAFDKSLAAQLAKANRQKRA
jgi:hypothetical protein